MNPTANPRFSIAKTVGRAPVAAATLTVLLGSLCIGCKPTPQTSPTANFQGQYPIAVTVTTGMIGDLVREIGGDQVQVTQLMAAGVDPHLYKPNRDAVISIRDADLVFYNGLMLEGKMSELLEKHSRLKRTFAVGESLPEDSIARDDVQAHVHPDPHVWMNVELWRQAAGAIGQELASFDPSHADQYTASAERFQAKLLQLHEYGIKVIGCIPEQQRVLVTSHDAFRYFGQAYGVEVQAIQGISTESEAGLSRINELVDLLVSRKISAIFTESSVPQDSIRALLRGAESKGHQVRIPAESLYSDAMGATGYEATYIGMMDHNLTLIARSLGCPTVPADGFRGTQE